MKKIINDPNKYLSEMLEGIYIAHQNQLTYVNDDPQCLVTKKKKQGRWESQPVEEADICLCFWDM